jgi:phospholipid/cholesterol/gamma-HCH transport system ATP-binding protein
MIKVVGLEKSFGGNHVLRGLDLEVERGETVVVIGRSGCGKSVLLKHIIGLIKPDAGKVYIDSQEITSLSKQKLHEIRLRFGMLFQSSALFDSFTVGENVGLALSEHTDLSSQRISGIVREKLEIVGLRNIEHVYPAELSGGMKKRVGLARAIAMDPEIILYDEPTTGLDPIMADTINRMIRRLQDRLQVTSVAVTHDMKSANFIADRIAMLHEGRIIHCGTPQEIMDSSDQTVRQFVEGISGDDVGNS